MQALTTSNHALNSLPGFF